MNKIKEVVNTKTGKVVTKVLIAVAAITALVIGGRALMAREATDEDFDIFEDGPADE